MVSEELGSTVAVNAVADEGGELNLDEQWRAAMAEMNAEWDEEDSGDQEDNSSHDELEQQALPPGIILDSLPPLMQQEDPHRMCLTLDEWDVAMSIKIVFSSNPDINHMSDFQLAQLALICNSAEISVEETLQRTIDLQCFQEEYDIRDTLEQGCQSIQDLARLFPEYLLHFGFHCDKGTYSLAFDHAKFDTTALTTEADFKKFMIGFYYMMQAVTCDLESTRKGHLVVIDCGEVGWSMKKDFKVLKELFSQLVCVYPFQPMAIRHYNTGVIFNLLFSMAKKVLPKKKRDPHEFGLSSDGPLKDTFLIPTVAAGTLRTILQIQDALKRRYENEKAFSLH